MILNQVNHQNNGRYYGKRYGYYRRYSRYGKYGYYKRYGHYSYESNYSADPKKRGNKENSKK